MGMDEETVRKLDPYVFWRRNLDLLQRGPSSDDELVTIGVEAGLTEDEARQAVSYLRGLPREEIH